MKGTIFDFLKLAVEKPELAKELSELATKYDFEFSDEELSETELDQVAGGTAEADSEINLELQTIADRRSELIQTLSNILKKIDSTQDSIVQNLK